MPSDARESGGRFVGDDVIRIACDRDRDHHPRWPHSPRREGKLVRYARNRSLVGMRPQGELRASS